MTVQEAERLLRPPLCFGDPHQIAAVRLLELANELRELAGDWFEVKGKCEECDGTGECECDQCGHDGECWSCDGAGTESREIAHMEANELREMIAEYVAEMAVAA